MGDNLNMLRHDDGKLYMFPNWYTSRPAGNAGYVVNKKIYDELGAPRWKRRTISITTWSK